ncbi:TRAPP subunit [Malassezia japonica]|uniref:TRAPP subunit n=1 Tax=Malassezia japonica TaxID=223818 RepID=A0AAF0F1N4_9BASI|nr:TRAPP subunit [Malassezia japonica]WFD41088.1 TRAPP subunit [Malassezia japonica]
MPYYFCIVGTRDNLLYEADLSARAPSAPAATRPSGEQSRNSGIFGFSTAFNTWTAPLARQGATSPAASSPAPEDNRGAAADEHHILQMIAHGSLDVLEDKQFVDSSVYLKSLDRINDWTVSAFLVPGNAKFIILHEHKHEEGIRNFLMDVWELWVKVMMNPFQEPNDPIRSPSFDTRLRAAARRHL